MRSEALERHQRADSQEAGGSSYKMICARPLLSQSVVVGRSFRNANHVTGPQNLRNGRTDTADPALHSSGGRCWSTPHTTTVARMPTARTTKIKRTTPRGPLGIEICPGTR